MRFLLLCLSVIMILRHAKSSKENDVKDISLWCKQGKKLDFNLTSGAGLSDVSVAAVTSVKDVNCSVTYKVKGSSRILLVVEFPDRKSDERVCFINKDNSVAIRNYSKEEACRENGTGSMYSVMSGGNVSVHFLSSDHLGSVKVIATSVRDAIGRSCKDNEIKCVYDKGIFCMTDKTLCDGVSNCGKLGSFDEDVRNCTGVELSIFLIFCTVIMVVLSFSLCVSGVIIQLPPLKQTFFQDTNRNAIFDDDMGLLKAEIIYRTISPDDD